MNILIFAILSAFVALGYSLYQLLLLFRVQSNNDKVKEVAALISQGAFTYLWEQYKVIFLLGSLIASGIFFLFNYNWWITNGFILGILASSLSGYLGMYIAVNANSRTAESAYHGIDVAFGTSFRAGTICGLALSGFALLTLSFYYYLMQVNLVEAKVIINALVTLGFGASLVSVFARLGGGIFTKGADIGADYVGKVEANLNEDDPRNPAVIADNVGDNVGDCAGTSADIFETYLISLIGAMLIADILFPLYPIMIFYPLLVAAVTMLGCIIGSFFTCLKKDGLVMHALYSSVILSIVVTIVLIGLLHCFIFDHSQLLEYGLSNFGLFVCVCLGFIITCLLIISTEYYTAIKFRPVQKIAYSSTKGSASNIIMGLAIGKESAVIPGLIICLGIVIAYILSGIYGIAITVVSMLSLAGIIIALDAYGPITDNAGGIAEMAALPKSVRLITDKLDSVGNTTKAVTKGYAIGSTGLSAIVLFSLFNTDINYFISNSSYYTYFQGVIVDFTLYNPYVIVGLLIGGGIPFIFAAFSMVAVGNAANDIVDEVRRQFKNEKIVKGEESPNYNQAISILTRAAIREMVYPSLLPVFMPIFFFSLFSLFSKSAGLEVLGSMLLGVIISGLYLANYMNNSGAAWDNAKKFIESGEYGGKGSEAHKASVVGDTVGDPYKDTAGPAINPMIKVINIISILLLLVMAS